MLYCNISRELEEYQMVNDNYYMASRALNMRPFNLIHFKYIHLIGKLKEIYI